MLQNPQRQLEEWEMVVAPAEEEGGWCLKEQVNATTYVKVKKMSVFKLMLKNH